MQASAEREELAGREKELDQLLRAHQEAIATRQVRFASIVGPPGVGKSRLLASLASLAESRGTRVLEGRPRRGQVEAHTLFTDLMASLLPLLGELMGPLELADLRRRLAPLVPGEPPV